jgi:hypothetical protein
LPLLVDCLGEGEDAHHITLRHPLQEVENLGDRVWGIAHAKVYPVEALQSEAIATTKTKLPKLPTFLN